MLILVRAKGGRDGTSASAVTGCRTTPVRGAGGQGGGAGRSTFVIQKSGPLLSNIYIIYIIYIIN